MIKKNNLFKNISLFLCLVPMLVLSLFCLVPSKQDFYVSAASDETFNAWRFEGSNFMVPITLLKKVTGSIFGTAPAMSWCSLNIDLSKNENGVVSYSVSGNCLIPTSSGGFSSSATINSHSYSTGGVRQILLSNSSYKIHYSVIVSGSLNNVYKVVFSSENYYLDDVINNHGIVNDITYYDNLDNYIRFRFTAVDVLESDVDMHGYAFDDRTYYFGSSFDMLDGYQVGFDTGYSEGYSNGVLNGSSSGYQEGYNAGEIVGYGNGYNQGLSDSGNYSFNNLLGAVIDAPVSAFTSLLNFEILGVNILSLITGLLSIAVIVLIVKLCMGGR